MSYLFTKSRNTLQKSYGWDVELVCSQCKFRGQPHYQGWSSSLTTSIPRATVYAKIVCPQCGSRLIDEAGRKLVELFKDLDPDPENRTIMSRFIVALILVPVVLAFVLFFGMQMDWWTWGFGTVWVLVISAVSVPLLVSEKNKQIARLPLSCQCGKPHYVYMGSVDDSSCFRCFSCGKLMKLRE